MITVHDRASAALALERNLDPPVKATLEAELALLTSGEHDLTDWTDILVVEPGDGEGEVAREAGFSPLVDPITGVRSDHPDFMPGWDLLTLRGGCWRLVQTFGSTFATILLIPNDERTDPALLNLCRRHGAA
jgi:hypothetical protein